MHTAELTRSYNSLSIPYRSEHIMSCLRSHQAHLPSSIPSKQCGIGSSAHHAPYDEYGHVHARRASPGTADGFRGRPEAHEMPSKSHLEQVKGECWCTAVTWAARPRRESMPAARQTFKRCRRRSLLARLGSGSEVRDPPPASPAAADLARQAGERARARDRGFLKTQ